MIDTPTRLSIVQPTAQRGLAIRRPQPRLLGAVMILTLVALVPLGALVLFVFNLGGQVHSRVGTQHAADSTVIAAAGWIARSLNTVAMNNVAQTRHLALINTLDALPLATEAALDEQTFLHHTLDRASRFDTGSQTLNNVVQNQIALLLDELDQEIKLLQEVHDLLQQYDISQMTHFKGPDGPGFIWRAMRGLDQISQATMENLGELTHLNAVCGGQANLSEDDPTTVALCIPVLPQVPWLRGTFDDFERPVTMGRLPDSLDNPHTNRGPYDTIFGWRHIVYHYEQNGGSSPGWVRSNVANPFGGKPTAPDTGPSGNTPKTPIGYRTHGTHDWALMRVRNFVYRSPDNDPNPANLDNSRFWPWFEDLANTKLRYTWQRIASQRFAKPHWNSSYPQVPINIDDPLGFSETAFFRLDIKSKYARSEQGFLTEGTWSIEWPPSSAHSSDQSMLMIMPSRRPESSLGRGWWLPNYQVNVNGRLYHQRMQDPIELSQHDTGAHIDQVGKYAWIYEYEYDLYADANIDIHAKLSPLGNPVPQKAYFIQLVLFAGTNRNQMAPRVFNASVATDVALNPLVVNPYAEFDHTAQDAPAPLHIDRNQINVGAPMTFLGIARSGDRALAWPRKFQAKSPYPGIVAIAQAQVFNNHSWDLWTQMWHAQLQPVTQYDQWLAKMTESMEDAANSGLVTVEDLDELRTYLASIEPLSHTMLSH